MVRLNVNIEHSSFFLEIHQPPFRKTFYQQSLDMNQYPPPIPPREPQSMTSYSHYQYPPPTTTTYTSSSNNNNNQIIKILAFGDSITEGMVNYGHEPFAPYTTKLEELLNSNSQNKGKLISPWTHSPLMPSFTTKYDFPLF